MKKLSLGLAIAAVFCAAAVPSDRPRLNLWVATVLCQNQAGFQMLSFVDAQTSRETVAGHLDTVIAEKFPGARVISVKIEPVADDLVDKICAARSAERRF